jgi:hypothetical protein
MGLLELANIGAKLRPRFYRGMEPASGAVGVGTFDAVQQSFLDLMRWILRPAFIKEANVAGIEFYTWRQ